MNKPLLSFASLLTLTSSLMAASFSDDFNRPSDVALTPLGLQIGKGWKIGTDYWSIENTAKDGYLYISKAQNKTNNSVVWNEAVPLQQSNGKRSAAQVDALAENKNSWAGLSFNVQDSDTFYQLRFKSETNSYQVVRHDNGEIKAVVSRSDASTVFEIGKFYRLTVYLGTDGDNSYRFTITDPDSPEDILNPDRSFEDSSLTGGYAGVSYGNWRTAYRYDNFHVENSE
ncbi:hypothetical protein ACWPKS_12220 [Coraliomargarita sp. W4R72]